MSQGLERYSRPYVELNDSGSVVAYYDADTFELEEVCSWNGAEVHHRWERIAIERLAELAELSRT